MKRVWIVLMFVVVAVAGGYEAQQRLFAESQIVRSHPHFTSIVRGHPLPGALVWYGPRLGSDSVYAWTPRAGSGGVVAYAAAGAQTTPDLLLELDSTRALAGRAASVGSQLRRRILHTRTIAVPRVHGRGIVLDPLNAAVLLRGGRTVVRIVLLNPERLPAIGALVRALIPYSAT